MYDSTLHAKTISRQFRKSDFEPGILHVPATDKAATVQRAVNLCETGFPDASLFRSNLGGKYVYQHRSVEQALIVRHITENVRRVTGVRQSDRQDIIRSISRLAGQGLPFKALKLDIRSFYESVNVSHIISMLRSDAAFSRQCVNLLDSYFSALDAQNIVGLPRGLSLSATLAEYIMRRFDATLSAMSNVRYYSRFVDDIIVIVSADTNIETLKETAQALLPNGLSLSRSKSVSYVFGGNVSPVDRSEEGSIVFLGYEISVGRIYRDSGRLRRDVRLDIAPSKVKKVKRRMAKALLSFNSGGDFDDLLDRFKMLTSNYGFTDYDTGQKRFSGIRYNYGLIRADQSIAIRDLDRFLLNSITNIHPSNRIRPTLTGAQRKKLLGLSFISGFETNRFFSFSDTDIARIARCWSHA